MEWIVPRWVKSNGLNGSVKVGNDHRLTGQYPTNTHIYMPIRISVRFLFSSEDPVLWQGRRGFYALLHSAPALTHVWSVDALHWEWTGNLTGPALVPGQGDHERPRVALGTNGNIDALFVSSNSAPSTSDASHLLVYRANSNSETSSRSADADRSTTF